jgi:hypothetical protein
MSLEKEAADLNRRMDLAETRLSQAEGGFQCICGQLPDDSQRFIRNHFSELETRLDDVNRQIDTIFANMMEQLDALPDLIAETITRND